MTKEQLQALISSGENEQLEFKETTGQRGDACQALCAFLNADGGTVVFGVSRKGTFLPTLSSITADMPQASKQRTGKQNYHLHPHSL